MVVPPRKELVVSNMTVPSETVVWRYFQFPRFLDVLQTHSLWFSRPFKFEDSEWEGRFPPSYLRRARQSCEAEGIPVEEVAREFHSRELVHRYGHFVSCWHMSSDESEAMWQLYADVRRGVAIQSTVGDVSDCLRPSNSGQVIYYDPSHDVISPELFGPPDILFKRRGFAWEREYRFWMNDNELISRVRAGRKVRPEQLSPGRKVQISDMPKLIKKVIVSPRSSEEFADEVRAACVAQRLSWLAKRVECSYSARSWESFTE